MSELLKSLQVQIADRMGSAPVQSSSVSGGCISQAALVCCEDSAKCFVKWNASAPSGFFSAEAEGLRALREARVIKVPEVYAVNENDDSSAPAAIIMEALEPSSGRAAGDAAMLGRALAELHKVSREAFGFDSDNFIGELPQSNDSEDTWGSFFFSQRLSKQAELGAQRGWFDAGLSALLSEKEELIVSALDEHRPRPSLLHGDLWSGNVFWADCGPALIDPAVYYGCREADIAMTECFGRFDAGFYKAYKETFPLDPGYERRQEILNLYHLMTHSNLFGGSYIPMVRERLASL